MTRRTLRRTRHHLGGAGDQGRARSGSTASDGRLATFSSPGKPDRPVALKRKQLPELLAEELRHLDEDDVYAATARALVKRAAS